MWAEQAAIVTNHSKLLIGAVPGVAALTGVEEDHGLTTGWSILWRTMSSPIRAVAGQWMRRRSSPSR